MTIQHINIGSVANDGQGDPARIAGGKINANFSELDLRTQRVVQELDGPLPQRPAVPATVPVQWLTFDDPNIGPQFYRDYWTPLQRPPELPLDVGALAWFDPSHLESMLAAGEEPASVDTEIASIVSREGNGILLTGSPLLTYENGLYGLSFDGVNDFLTGTLNLSSVNKVTAVVAFSIAADAVQVELIAHGAGTTNLWRAGWDTYFPPPVNVEPRFICSSAGAGVLRTAPGLVGMQYLQPLTGVLTLQADTTNSASSVRGRFNRGSWGTQTANQSGGNYQNGTLRIGSRVDGTRKLKGLIYQALIFDHWPSTDNLEAAEDYAAFRAGLTL